MNSEGVEAKHHLGHNFVQPCGLEVPVYYSCFYAYICVCVFSLPPPP